MPFVPTSHQKIAHTPLPQYCDTDVDHLFYVDTGGRPLARHLSEVLDIPATPLDIRYPFSRVMMAAPVLVRPVLWIFKELVYRLTVPALPADNNCPSLPAPEGGTVLLVDDSASSGRTLQLALKTLNAAGFPSNRIFIVVERCGKGAQHLLGKASDPPKRSALSPFLRCGGDRRKNSVR